MTRDEHIQWCKQRALLELEQSIKNAMASLLSDLSKHPETQNHPGIIIGMERLFKGELSTYVKMKAFIDRID